jgi:thiamine-phosphate pyrophosphorylase
VTPSAVWVLTDRRQADRGLVEVVGAAIAGGARHVVLREKDLPRAQRAALAVELRAMLAPVGGQLVVAGPDPLIDPAGLAAVHLAAADPLPAQSVALIGRSCHHEEDLAGLTVEDYITLSPVFPSPSKPGYGPPLWPDGLARLCARTPVPVVALGGVTSPDRAAACTAAGAAAVAVMGAIMRAADPASMIASFLATIATAIQPAKADSPSATGTGGRGEDAGR